MRICPLTRKKISLPKLKEAENDIRTFIDAYQNVIHLSDNSEIEDLKSHPWFGVTASDVREARKINEVKERLEKTQVGILQIKSELKILNDDFSLTFSEEVKDFIEEVKKLRGLPGGSDGVCWSELAKLSNKECRDNLICYIDLFKQIRDFLIQAKRILSERGLAGVWKKEEDYDLSLYGTRGSISIEELKENYKELKAAKEEFSRKLHGLKERLDYLPDSLFGEVFSENSLEGAKFLKEFVKDLSSLPKHLRGIQWDVSGSSRSNVKEFHKCVSHFVENQQKVDPIYDLKMLPSYAEVKNVVLRYQQAGFLERVFSIFGGEYAGAKKKILSWARDGGRCFDKTALEDLVNYVCARDEYEDHDFQKAFGELFKGVETSVDDLNAYLDWKEMMNKKYGYLRGACEYVFGLKLFDYERLLAAGVEKYVTAVETLQGLLKNFPESSEVLKDGWLSEKFGIDKFDNDLQEKIDLLQECAASTQVSLQQLRTLDEEKNEAIEAFNEWSILKQKDFGFKHWIPYDFESDGEEEGILCINKTVAFFDELKARLPQKIDFVEFLKTLTKESYGIVLNHVNSLSLVLGSFLSDYKEFGRIVGLEEDSWQGGMGFTLNNLYSKNRTALLHIKDLPSWVEYIREIKRLEQKHSIGMPIVTQFRNGAIELDDMKDLLYYDVAVKVSDEIKNKYPHLPTDSILEERQKNFCRCDTALYENVRKLIASELASHKGCSGIRGSKVGDLTEMALIEHEIKKQRRHISLRSLIKRAKESLFDIKPCWMMSPFSVAQVLEPGKVMFDLIVMDEASQILPEYAIGALARGRQAVIVGDPKQLPPTTFFKAGYGDRDEDEDEDEEGIDKQESILESFSSYIPHRQLLWHYRSQHEDLIKFSNREFYSDELVIFPSSQPKNKDLGVRFTYVENGVFAAHVNNGEAMRVARAIVDHAHQHPNESLGVVAMNSAQRDRIEECLENITHGFDKQVDDLVNRKFDGLFIKNLENVQGDERDVIFISFTYGKDQDSGRVMQRFGPINSEKGWRRLNVLFTRARKRMHVFSSMRDTDILPNSGSPAYKSVKALRDFLTYAETGRLPISTTQGMRQPDSDFEIAVKEMLEERGFECRPQVGVAKFFIDIGVVDPCDPGAYLMGIECDGATYHSSRTARDRDHLRQQILESKGWKIYRIWSTEWFENPVATLEPCIKELTKLAQESKERHRGLGGEPLQKEIMIPNLQINTSCDVKKGQNEESESEEDRTLRAQLLKLRDEIRREFPDVPEERALLRDKLLNMFVRCKPTNSEKFGNLIPDKVRLTIDPNQAKNYLSKVYEIIEDYS